MQLSGQDAGGSCAVKPCPRLSGELSRKMDCGPDAGKTRALSALLSCKSVEEAPHQSEVSRATLFRWLREDEEFQGGIPKGWFRVKVPESTVATSPVWAAFSRQLFTSLRTGHPETMKRSVGWTKRSAAHQVFS